MRAARAVRRAVRLLTAAAACAAAAAPGLGAQPAPPPAAAAAPVPRYSAEAFFTNVAYAGASYSPDGRHVLVSSNATGVFNLYAVPAAGGAPVQLTRSAGDAVRPIGYFPADERILYTQDQGGNELAHVFVRERDGSTRDLTPGAGHRAQFGGWMRDDRGFVVQTNERDKQAFDVYEYAADGYARTRLYQNPGGFFPAGVSPDRRYVALVKANGTNDSDVYLHDRTTGRTRNLTAHSGQVSNGVADFAPDGRSLYLTTDEGSEFAYLVRHDLATGRRETVVKPEWDVTSASFSRGGRHLVVSVNADARTDVRVYAWPSMRPVPLPAVAGANITGVAFSRDDGRVAFYASSSRAPSDLYAAAVGAPAPTRLTASLNPAIDARHLVDARVVRFKSYDGLEVPGVLYLPHGASPSRRVPGIVHVHGGPGGQARLGWNAGIQYLVNQGYAVYDINNRGSSGYGKTFYAMDDRRHGEADLGDVVAAKTLFAATGGVDTARTAVMGGSYGGYMTLAALTLRPTEFVAGVDVFGPANWIRTLRSIPAWWGAQRASLYAELGDPAADSLRLVRVSPLFNADKIRRPLLVIQGANDPRVLQRESDDIVAAARRNGVPVEYLVFPDEGHGFSKRANSIKAYDAIARFLDQRVRERARPSAM